VEDENARQVLQLWQNTCCEVHKVLKHLDNAWSFRLCVAQGGEERERLQDELAMLKRVLDTFVAQTDVAWGHVAEVRRMASTMSKAAEQANNAMKRWALDRNGTMYRLIPAEFGAVIGSMVFTPL
jgi:hypothetical protein